MRLMYDTFLLTVLDHIPEAGKRFWISRGNNTENNTENNFFSEIRDFRDQTEISAAFLTKVQQTHHNN